MLRSQLRVAYEKGQGSIAMPLLLIFAFLTGLGSCSGFSAAIKTGEFRDTSKALRVLMQFSGL